MAGKDNRHVIYLKEGGSRSDAVQGELKHLHQVDMDDNFKVFMCGRHGQLPEGVRGAPTIYYMQENGRYHVIEGNECVDLVSRMCATLMKLRSERDRRIDTGTRLPGRAPPTVDNHGGRGESFSEELFRTKHLQNRPSEAGPLQPGGFQGSKIQASDLEAMEAARTAADRAVDAQYGSSDGGPVAGQSRSYYPSQPQQGGYQAPQYHQPQQQQQQYQPQQYQPPQYHQNGMVGNRSY